MRKKMMIWALAMGCLVATTGLASAATKKAAPAECKVESVEGAKVVLNCGEAGKELAAGATVTLKVKAAAAAKPATTAPAEPAKPAATAPTKPAEPATPATPATPAKPAKPAKKKIEGC